MDETAKNVQELKMIIREPEDINIIKPDLEIIKLQGEGYERLGMLYNDGYHVCPSNFGDKRQEECLFCLAFINKE
jgi:regulator of replication initiation timing